MSVAECVQFERKMAYFMAPTLLGVKCASLMSISKTTFSVSEHLELFHARAEGKGLKMQLLCDCETRALLFLYQETLLKQQLSDPNVAAILQRYHYPNPLTPETALQHLSRRIRISKPFPHEIGVFLGYPVEDVIGFIENKGKNYVLCKYWKVYRNVEQAKHTFERYDQCRAFLCNQLNQGYDLYQALKIS